MRYTLVLFVLSAFIVLPRTGWTADCYADYKAKQDNPLRLHYGVMQLRDKCDRGQAQTEVAARLGANGWTLLNVLSVFGPDELQGKKANAGPYFLRF